VVEMTRRDLRAALAGFAAVAVLGGGAAWAAIPDGSGAIQGCYQKNVGNLRVVDPDTGGCRPSEIALVWNARGVPGPPGEAGAPGRDGHDGRDGRDGVDATVATEPPGSKCRNGGVKVTAASGVAYVCGALPPDPGPD
jgi:hypothetical protein